MTRPDPGRPDPRLVLICGLPGAGKTTLARQLAAALPAVRLCPDEWLATLGFDLFAGEPRDRLEGLFWEHTQQLLRLGQSVILEFGFWGRAERDAMRLRARDIGAGVELRHLDVSVDELCRRLAVRNASGAWDTVTITRDMVEAYAESFEAPDAAELALFDEPARTGPDTCTEPDHRPQDPHR